MTFSRALRSILLAGMLAGAAAEAAPVRVLELFQSQGCSSCPPANANLNALADRPDIIALNFSVTYWDHLGWKDRFARPAFTARQRAYAPALGNSNVYTPQMVVNGRRDLVGNAASDVDAALKASSPLDGSRITVAGGTARVKDAGTPADLWLVGYDPGVRHVSISAGENRGRKLPHRNVVTSLIRLGGAGAAVAIPVASKGEARVLILQGAGGGPILDAVRL